MLLIYLLQVVNSQEMIVQLEQVCSLCITHSVTLLTTYTVHVKLQENERIKLDLQLLEVKYEKEQKVTDTTTHYSHKY